jgi:flagellin
MTSPSSIPGPTSQRILSFTAAQRADSLKKLATGFRINAGRDDPAGLIASENLRATLAALDAESRALQRTDSVVATAEGALAEVSDLLVEAEALAVANANTGAMSDAERRANQQQLDSILQTVDRVAGTASFNGQKLLDGSMEISGSGGSIAIESAAVRDLGSVDDGAGNAYDLADVASGRPLDTARGDVGLAAASIRAATQQIATQRGRLGAFSANVIRPTLASNEVAFENVAAANSIIRDTDYARETANQARLGALMDVNFALLATSNANAGRALGLLG